MKKIFRKEVLIGVLAIAALLILFFGINFLKGFNIFKASNYYYASYTNVEGLTQSAPVTLNGFKIGIVREIKYDYSNPGHVVVEISLDKELKVPAGTQALVSTDLLGTASVVLHMGDSKDGFYAPGDTIPSGKVPGMMDAVSQNVMPAVANIFPKIDTLITSLNAIASDPALVASVQRLDALTRELDCTIRSLHVVINNLQPVTTDVKTITGNVGSMTGDLAAITGTLREAPVDSLIISLQGTMANLETLTSELNDPNGSFGKLAKDPALYDNLNHTISSLDSLFIDIKKNPKRYISIKLF